MNLQELGNLLKQKVNRKEGMLFREGPSHVQKELWFDVVVEGVIDGKNVFAKGYTDNSREYYKFELDFTNKINEFAALHSDYHLSGTQILDHNDEHTYFIMKAIQLPKLDVKQLNLSEVAILQERITNFFSGLKSHFGLSYFVGWHEQEKYAELVQHFYDKTQVDQEGVNQLFAGMIKLTKSRIANGERNGFVQSVVDYNKEQILDLLDQFASKVMLENAICDSIGILWDGHVYGNVKDKLELIDFDRLIPSLNGYDFTALLFNSLGLNTFDYEDYSSYKNKFMNVVSQLDMLKDQSLKNFLLLQKLIGTTFNDYGWLLLERQNHLESFAKLGIDPQENSRRGIERNFNLMYELFNIAYKPIGKNN